MLRETDSYYLPPRDERVTIHEVVVSIPRFFGLPPIVANRPIEQCPAQVIFADGGTQNGTSISSAGIVVRQRGTDPTPDFWDPDRDGARCALLPSDEQHAKYYVSSTNNAMELTAFIAMCRYAKKHPRVSVGVIDSKWVYDAIVGKPRITKLILKKYVEDAKQAYSDVSSFLTIGHMMRHYGNPADVVVKDARRIGAALPNTDNELFPEPPDCSTHSARAAQMPKVDKPIRTSVDDIVQQITSVEEFATLYRYNARGSCPTACLNAWAAIVAQQVAAVTQAKTDVDRDRAMIGLLILPNVFLPTQKSISQIQHHMIETKPFHVDVPRDANRVQPDAAPPAEAADEPSPEPQERNMKRLGQAVARLAFDRKIKSAVKLLHQAANAEDIPFETKLAKLRTKFIPRCDAVAEHPLTRTASFDTVRINDVLKHMPKQAATCIDRWTPKLLLQAIAVLPTIADDIGVICAQINDDVYGPLVQDCIRMGRCVGIPKEEDKNSVRPIVLSCFFAKLTGGLVFAASRPKCSRNQFALGIKRGAERIIHQVREEFRNGKVVIRIDVSNAFNTAKRAHIERLLREKGAEEAMRVFFKTMYHKSAKLAVYGPHAAKIEFIDFEEGIRQGDAFSAYFFCLLMDEVIADILKIHPHVHARAFMDDLTITADATDAEAITETVVAALRHWGFTPNPDKSKILCRAEDAEQLSHIPQIQIQSAGKFRVLGANITDEYAQYNDEQQRKVDKFFTALEQVQLHPHLAFTIMRLCGNPKMIFYASTTPPEHSLRVVEGFQRRLIQTAERILDFEIPALVQHLKHGAGLPDYVTRRQMLYENAKMMSLQGTQPVPVELVYDTDPKLVGDKLAAHLEGQHTAEWLFYLPPNSAGHLNPMEFKLAMAIRCHTLPKTTLRALARQCNCGFMMRTPEDIIDHVLVCNKASFFTKATRHNLVKYGIVEVLRRYALHAIVEPNMYVYPPGEAHRRPDITVMATPPLATDIVVVQQHGLIVGQNAEKEAAVKNATHAEAVGKFGHQFIPIAMETHGFKDKSCYDWVNRIRSFVQPHLADRIRDDLHQAMACALAKSRALTIQAAQTSQLLYVYR